MEQPTSSLESFVRAVQSRLNRFRLLQAFFTGLLVGAVFAAVVAMAYVAFGYAVPVSLYWLSGGIVLAVTCFVWLWKRCSRDGAAHFADSFFGLKDTVSSALHFRESGKTSDFVELQSRAAAEAVNEVEPRAIPFQFPRRIVGFAVFFVLIAGSLAFKEPSQEVLDQMRTEAETLTKSQEINEHLEELVEELEKSLEEDELDEIDTAEIRRAIDELDKTEDRKEAMRQYAELERRLREAAQRLEQRRNEQLMAKVGEELQKDPESRELGRKMEEKQYREAAADLAKMQEQVNAPERKLSEQRKELARLKAASMRMAAAAKAASREGASASGSGKESGSSSGNQNSGSGSKGGESGGGKSGGGGSGGEGEGMEDLLAQLSDAVGDLDKNLEKAEQEAKLSGKTSDKTAGDCKACRSAVNKKLDELNKSLCRMGAKCQSRQQLLSMCRSLGQCQGYLNDSQCQSLSQCMGTKPGSGIGSGSVESRREGGDDFMSGGELTQLQGQKGEGPSTSKVESATSGDGVSSRRTTNQRRDFQKQMESFVQREDVPDEVKDGVKNYFTRIHATSEE